MDEVGRSDSGDEVAMVAMTRRVCEGGVNYRGFVMDSTWQRVKARRSTGTSSHSLANVLRAGGWLRLPKQGYITVVTQSPSPSSRSAKALSQQPFFTQPTPELLSPSTPHVHTSRSIYKKNKKVIGAWRNRTAVGTATTLRATTTPLKNVS